jgi:hypothetical protein
MSLAIDYCKEIIKELDKIPVFLPGDTVSVGDIITFDNKKPIGSFKLVSNLTKLSVSFEEIESTDNHPYIYASKGSTSVNFTANANAATSVNGKLEIKFSKEGATYFAAIDCKVKSISDITNLKEQLEPHKEKINWNECYIVTSITIAKRALIMISNSENASLEIDGDVKGFLPDTDNRNINANISLKINSFKDHSFLKPWSENVTVFFGLVRYYKKIFGGWGMDYKPQFMTNNSKEYELESVLPNHILDEQ